MNAHVKASVRLLAVLPLVGLPLIEPGDDLAQLLITAIDELGLQLGRREVVVVTSKIVSKAEGRYARLAEVRPGPEALQYASISGKDPRLVELVLGESEEVLRCRPGTMIVAHRLGHVQANAGIDQSNIADAEARVLLLPVDPDRTSGELKARLDAAYETDVAVVIADSLGRAWRKGTVGVAIGAAGLPSLRDLRGEPDLFGRALTISETGFADEIAAAATLVMGQGAEGAPAAILRGLSWRGAPTGARALLRKPEEDLFR